MTEPTPREQEIFDLGIHAAIRFLEELAALGIRVDFSLKR